MFNIWLVGDQFSALRYCYFSNGSEGNVFNLYKVMFGIIEMKGIGCDSSFFKINIEVVFRLHSTYSPCHPQSRFEPN